jgi:hypothetical protein
LTQKSNTSRSNTGSNQAIFYKLVTKNEKYFCKRHPAISKSALKINITLILNMNSPLIMFLIANRRIISRECRDIESKVRKNLTFVIF